jgi:hypothetical protein
MVHETRNYIDTSNHTTSYSSCLIVTRIFVDTWMILHGG